MRLVLPRIKRFQSQPPAFKQFIYKNISICMHLILIKFRIAHVQVMNISNTAL